MTTADRFIATPLGRIHCTDQGEGPPLVLIHSNGCSVHEFDAALPWLTPDFRCIAIDLPGHGDSDPPRGHQTISDYASAVVSVLDALGLEQAHICGASVGGFICIALGIEHPQRVASLTIVEAALRTPQEWAGQWPRVEAMFAIAQQTHDEIAPRLREVTPALLGRWNIDRAKAGGWRMVDVMWAIREYDAMAELARLRVPTAVVIGSLGPVFAGRSRFAEALPSAPIRVLAQAGHFPMIDLPDAFAHAVRDGIAEVTAGRA